jgi:putative sugar O-methyltransferase
MNVKLKAALWRFAGFFKPGRSRVGELPSDVIQYLSPDNPFLKELKKRYAVFSESPHSNWEFWENKVNLLKFRGENDYVSQAYFLNTTRRYELTLAYAEALDTLGLFDLLKEDELFGVKTWEFVPGKLISRDLIDSIIEITFLSQTLGFKLNDRFRILDIGAGYGRFSHRFTTAFPNGSATCIDAVPTSTFLSNFYLKFRNCDRAKVVSLDRVADLQNGTYDLAMNIHSWTECTKQFIAFWLDRLCDLKVPYLFIVPHFGNLSTHETDGSSLTYDDELERRGFKLVLKQRKFHKSKFVDSMGVFPADYWLFKREIK